MFAAYASLSKAEKYSENITEIFLIIIFYLLYTTIEAKKRKYLFHGLLN